MVTTRKEIIKTKNKNLYNIINDSVYLYGFNCDLNHIDVSEVTSMKKIFINSKFNGDISKWNVGNVMDMSWMFCFCNLSCHLSNWNVSNVNNMTNILCGSLNDLEISQWRPKKLELSFFEYVKDINKKIEKMPEEITNDYMSELLSESSTRFLSDFGKSNPWWSKAIIFFNKWESMYDSIEELKWIDFEKKVIWKKRLVYAIQDFGNYDLYLIISNYLKDVNSNIDLSYKLV